MQQQRSPFLQLQDLCLGMQQDQPMIGPAPQRTQCGRSDISASGHTGLVDPQGVYPSHHEHDHTVSEDNEPQ